MPEMLALRDMDPREVGAYRLLGRLGEGGQGVVFLAEDPAGASVAVKLLPPTTDPQVRSRFLKEVAAAQRVARFCTAQVLDAGIFERRPFIVSEFVSGPSLVEIVEQDGPRSGAALERLAVATLTALGAVHAAGMVHRDFKPANVLLGPDGPVVIDFGLAAVPGMTTVMSTETTIGTPAFMAPEQLAGSRVTAAADMWSWAVTMVFAGTGELPFNGVSLTAAAYAILHSEPTIGLLPRPLHSLVHRCLSKDPAARPSARDVLGELVASGARLVAPIPPPQTSVLSADEATIPNPPPAATGPLASAPGGLLSPGEPSGPRSARHQNRRSRWRKRAPLLLAAVVLAAAGSTLGFALSRHGPTTDQLAGGSSSGSSAQASQKLTADQLARSQAVTWILGQVSRAAVVSCDRAMCSALVSGGFPAANLLFLDPSSNDPLGSSLVVATAAVRAQFGTRLDTVYAPATIASFGSGNTQIDVRLVYPGGSASYRAAAQSALAERKASGAQLVANSHVTVSPSARAQLLSGAVDPRLPALLAIMAEIHPVAIVDFAGQPAGAGTADLLRSVDLATGVSAAHLSPAAYLSWMKAFISAQRAQFLPASTVEVTAPAGQPALRISYSAPSPLS